MRNRLSTIILLLALFGMRAWADTIPTMFSLPAEWRIGAEIGGGGVLRTNSYLEGDNHLDKKAGGVIGGTLRADFSFNPSTAEGMLFPGLYQGVGVGVNGYLPKELLGNPVSVYVYQGMPIARLSSRVSLGYEWQFGVAVGWKHYDMDTAQDNVAVGSPATAHMGLRFKLDYRISDRWIMTFGLGANHYSNGNTSWPNGGVNTLGGSIGVAYIINPQPNVAMPAEKLSKEADRLRWVYDILVYGAWRKRAVSVGDPKEPMLCPGKFGVLGLQFSPLCKLNRWIAVGPALDIQWDESAGLEPYWIAGSYNKNIMFERPPFGKQLSVGLSAHAELTMPIFSLNIGLGYDMLNPVGDKAFYQSISLKTFVTKHFYINTGYRLGNFSTPQNLMLGIGVRL